MNIPPLARRLAGIAILLCAALVWSPYPTGPLQTIGLPALAAIGVWLVFPNPVLLAFAVTMLAGAHSRPGASDPLAGYIYPAITLGAAIVLVLAWRRREIRADTADLQKPSA